MLSCGSFFKLHWFQKRCLLLFSLVLISSIIIPNSINYILFPFYRNRSVLFLRFQLIVIPILCIITYITMITRTSFLHSISHDARHVDRLKSLPSFFLIVLLLFNVAGSMIVGLGVLSTETFERETYIIGSLIILASTFFHGVGLYIGIIIIFRKNQVRITREIKKCEIDFFTSIKLSSLIIINTLALLPIVLIMFIFLFFKFYSLTHGFFVIFFLIGIAVIVGCIAAQYLFIKSFFNRVEVEPIDNDEIVPSSFIYNYEITNREREVLELLCYGLTNKEIAEEMDISFKTVKNHLYNIFRKTQVTNRSQLVRFLQKEAN